MIDEYKILIRQLLRRIPRHLKDDCYQAACLGLVKALNKKDSIRNFKPYAYKCMQVEIIQELATLHDPFPVDHNTYYLLSKYKNAKRNNVDIESLSLTDDRLSNLERLCNTKRVSYTETFKEENVV